MLTAESFLRSGKVRDLYELPDRRMLLIASDRISAFDVVLPADIPDKGRVLTGLSRFWFAETQAIIPNHLLDTDPAILRDAWEVAIESRPADGQAGPLAVGSFEAWRGRMMICQNASVVPVEAVVRGYLAGSAWTEYQASGSVCGIALPSGLREGDELPEPIFTPATKAGAGEHDQNVDFDAMIQHLEGTWILPAQYVGPIAELIRTRSIALYRYAAAIVARTGIIVADTKFEFGVGQAWGLDDQQSGPPEERIARGRRPAGRRPADRNWQRLEDQLILIDEALTPDSSRFWDAATYEPGRSQASFDKQFVRDYLETLDWDKTAPGPALPDDVIAGTRARYVEAFERITGASFARYLQEDVIAR